MTNRDPWEDPVDEVRGGRIRHPPAAARRAKASALAREGDQSIVSATVAVHAQESMCQHTALEIGPQLALDESRHGCTVLSRIREERLELLADDFVEECLLRLVALVSGHGAPGRDRRGGRRSEA